MGLISLFMYEIVGEDYVKFVKEKNLVWRCCQVIERESCVCLLADASMSVWKGLRTMQCEMLSVDASILVDTYEKVFYLKRKHVLCMSLCSHVCHVLYYCTWGCLLLLPESYEVFRATPIETQHKKHTKDIRSKKCEHSTADLQVQFLCLIFKDWRSDLFHLQTSEWV